MRITLLCAILACLSGCSWWKEFKIEESTFGPEVKTPVGSLVLPRNRVLTGTAYDCITDEKRVFLGYKLFEWDTRIGTFTTGPMGYTDYIGWFGARKTSFWGYWLGVYGGRDYDSDENTYGFAYMKTF